MEKEKLDLGAVQETLLLPLWGRSVETGKDSPLLVDHLAASIVASLDYDFSLIARKVNPLSRLSWIARSLYFDGKIRSFLEAHPEGTIINLGCGLDTTFDRVDNGKASWYELDLPDVIELRRRFIQESARRTFIGESILDDAWYGRIARRDQVMLLMAGVIYYFEEAEVRALLRELGRRFPACELLFDYSSSRGVRIANRQVIKKGGMDAAARLRWGMDDIGDIETWDGPVKLLDTMAMFKRHKESYPARKRIGMNISDSLKIMSLAHLRLGEA